MPMIIPILADNSGYLQHVVAPNIERCKLLSPIAIIKSAYVDHRVLAPADGYVLEFKVQEGAFVIQGQSIAIFDALD